MLLELQAAFSVLDTLINQAVTHLIDQGGDPNDALRGLMVTQDEAAALIGQQPMTSTLPAFDLPPLPIADDSRLGRWMDEFGLSPLDVYLLLFALMPDMDRRYERLYGFLQDDVTLRRATPYLLINLFGSHISHHAAILARLAPDAPLRHFGLIRLHNDTNRPNSGLLTQLIFVDARVIHAVMGIDSLDERVRHALWIEPARHLHIAAAQLAAAQTLPAPMIALEGADAATRRAAAADFADRAGMPLVVIDAGALLTTDLPPETAWQIALREAHLIGAALYIEAWGAVFRDEAGGDRMAYPARLVWERVRDYPHPVFLCGLQHWEPLETARTRRLLRAALTIPGFEERRDLWGTLMADHAAAIDAPHVEQVAGKFRFTPAQTARALQTAADLAASRGAAMTYDDVIAGAQAQSALRLGQLARRVTPRMTWDDLILPPEPLEMLHEIGARAQFAHVVQDRWGFGGRYANVGGVSAMFAGDSGTGKTLAAEVIAHDLGLPMYTIDLSAVVSKYIGETEKNLGAIFAEARSSHAVLFFDEADALFGKRSEVKDARDRYSNIEIAYLLQQIEQYDGIAIMATNLRQNIDDAFTRRLDFLIDFPFPEPDYRLRLWAHHFPPGAPLGQDVDLRRVAEQHRLAGGNIRNAAIASAFFAAADGGTIHMGHIQNAIRREHQKMGRLIES
ncbi:MAG: ATP-binding protein [bacterium]|nr:ATP-binding protein [bacterium]